jgi:hypothetical protein
LSVLVFVVLGREIFDNGATLGGRWRPLGEVAGVPERLLVG